MNGRWEGGHILRSRPYLNRFDPSPNQAGLVVLQVVQLYTCNNVDTRLKSQPVHALYMELYHENIEKI